MKVNITYEHSILVTDNTFLLSVLDSKIETVNVLTPLSCIGW